jgi:hypothetical protein
MPALNRTLIKSGPAIVTWNGATLYFKDGVSIEEERTFFDVRVDNFPGSDKHANDRVVTIKGTPAGEWESLSVLFPWLSSPAGARLFGAADKPAVVKFLDGDVFTYHNAGLAEMPALFFSPVKTLLGSITLECRNANNTEADNAASFVTRSSSAFSDTGFSFANVKTLAYSLAFGADPWDDFQTVDGVEIRPRVSWKEIECDNLGVVEKELMTLEVTAAFAPLGIAQADIDAKLAMQGSAASLRGARVSETVGADFVLSASGVYVALNNAILRTAPMKAQAGMARHQRFEAVASLEITTGAQVAQLIVGTAAP